jgi:hypothetical protein
VTDTTFYVGNRKLPDLKVPRHCPFVLLAKISWIALGSGLCYEQRKEAEQDFY